MKKPLGIVMLMAFVLIGLAPLSAQQGPEDAKFQKFLDAYLDDYWKTNPTAGTLAGFTKYNDKLEDPAESAIEKRRNALETFNQNFVAKVDRTKLTPENQALISMVIDALDIEFVRYENILPWEYNPLYYNDILFESIHGLLDGNSAPLDARIKAATERAKLIPAFVKKAKDNLKTPPQLFTEVAIKQMPAIINYYITEVPNIVASAAAKTGFLTELGKAAAALDDYQSYLQGTLLPKSTGNFRIGPDAHVRLLRMTVQGNIPVEEVIARAKADYNNIRRDMFLVCIPFHRILFPELNIEQMSTKLNEEDLKNTVIKGVFDKIKTGHATKDGFVAAVAASQAKLQAFAAQTKLFGIPEAALKVEAMPEARRGVAITKLIPPGAYAADGGYTVQVAPIPADWTEAQATSLLEAYNDFSIDFLTLQDVFPGTFVPTFFTRKNAPVGQKILANQALLKGWPAYSAEALVVAGYGNYDLRLRLNQLKLQLKTVMDFQMDLNIHQSSMTKDQAMRYMTIQGFLTDQEAELNWNRILLNPGDASLPYMGHQEILEMEKEYKKLKGNAYDQKEFMQKLVSFGAIPLRDLKTRVVQ